MFPSGSGMLGMFILCLPIMHRLRGYTQRQAHVNPFGFRKAYGDFFRLFVLGWHTSLYLQYNIGNICVLHARRVKGTRRPVGILVCQQNFRHPFETAMMKICRIAYDVCGRWRS